MKNTTNGSNVRIYTLESLKTPGFYFSKAFRLELEVSTFLTDSDSLFIHLREQEDYFRGLVLYQQALDYLLEDASSHNLGGEVNEFLADDSFPWLARNVCSSPISIFTTRKRKGLFFKLCERRQCYKNANLLEIKKDFLRQLYRQM